MKNFPAIWPMYRCFFRTPVLTAVSYLHQPRLNHRESLNALAKIFLNLLLIMSNG
jgi:hypothetical protein